MQLSENLTDILVERGGHRVARQVTKNRGSRFSLAGYGKLTTRAQYDRKLALALAARGDLPRQCFLKLLESASASVRERLEAAPGIRRRDPPDGRRACGPPAAGSARAVEGACRRHAQSGTPLPHAAGHRRACAYAGR